MDQLFQLCAYRILIGELDNDIYGGRLFLHNCIDSPDGLVTIYWNDAETVRQYRQTLVALLAVLGVVAIWIAVKGLRVVGSYASQITGNMHSPFQFAARLNTIAKRVEANDWCSQAQLLDEWAAGCHVHAACVPPLMYFPHEGCMSHDHKIPSHTI